MVATKTIIDFNRHFQALQPTGSQIEQAKAYIQPTLTEDGLKAAQAWPIANSNKAEYYDAIIYTGRVRTAQSSIPCREFFNLPWVCHPQLRSTDIIDWQLLATNLIGLNGDPKGFCKMYADRDIGVELPEYFHKRIEKEILLLIHIYRGKKILFWGHEESYWSLKAMRDSLPFLAVMLSTPTIPFGRGGRFEF